MFDIDEYICKNILILTSAAQRLNSCLPLPSRPHCAKAAGPILSENIASCDNVICAAISLESLLINF